MPEPSPTEPTYESIELTSLEAYELAELNDRHAALQHRMDDSAARINTLAEGILTRATDCKPLTTEGWDFHIDAKGKRVVLRREAPSEDGSDAD